MVMTTCNQPGCPRAVHNAGMCRPCREKHLHGGKPRKHYAREVTDRLTELVGLYGNLHAVAKHIGASRSSLARLTSVPGNAPIRVTLYDAITNHTPDPHVLPAPRETTWADTAAYATTVEGRAFIAECRGAA